MESMLPAKPSSRPTPCTPVNMKIAGLQKLTLLDYPGRLAATLFTPGCNLRCPFCHNAPLVEENGSAVLSDGSNIDCEYTPSSVLEFLAERKGRLTGVAITGGEPLMQNGIEDFIRDIKGIGLDVKLDTNGSFPEKLDYLISEGLVDYVAMDLKNSWEKYPITVGGHPAMDKIKTSFEMLKEGRVDYEFRTTVVKELHELSDIQAMASEVMTGFGDAEIMNGFASKQLPKYFLQNFVDSGALLSSGYSAHPRETMLEFLNAAKAICPTTQLRGID